MSDHSIRYRSLKFMGFPNHYVGTDGSAWSWKSGDRERGTKPRWKRLKPQAAPCKYTADGKSPYKRIELGRAKWYLIHRLVLMAFIGPCPEGMEACHDDGDPSNNSLDNLRWDTRRGNISDKLRHGTDARGTKSARAKLTEFRVRKIRIRYRKLLTGETSWPTRKAFAEHYADRYGVHFKTILAIARNPALWPHVVVRTR